MLFRRTCKLVEFENATKALEKAKPKNQETVSYADVDYNSRRLLTPVLGWVHTTPEKKSWKRRFHSENASNAFRPHYAAGILKRRFHSENASNVFRPHYAAEILKRRFHSENASNFFRPHYAAGILKRRFHSETILGDPGAVSEGRESLNRREKNSGKEKSRTRI